MCLLCSLMPLTTYASATYYNGGNYWRFYYQDSGAQGLKFTQASNSKDSGSTYLSVFDYSYLPYFDWDKGTNPPARFTWNQWISNGAPVCNVYSGYTICWEGWHYIYQGRTYSIQIELELVSNGHFYPTIFVENDGSTWTENWFFHDLTDYNFGTNLETFKYWDFDPGASTHDWKEIYTESVLGDNPNSRSGTGWKATVRGMGSDGTVLNNRVDIDDYCSGYPTLKNYYTVNTGTPLYFDTDPNWNVVEGNPIHKQDLTVWGSSWFQTSASLSYTIDEKEHYFRTD